MEKEINVELFEKNARLYNKKNLKRHYASIWEHAKEYGFIVPPLGCRGDFVIKASIDKEFVEEFIGFLEERKLNIIGVNNHYQLRYVLEDYEIYKNAMNDISENIKKIEEEYQRQLNIKEKYMVNENDDAVFYFYPFNEDVDTLFEFYLRYKDEILDFAKQRDITIMFDLESFYNFATGFMAFNFLDSDNNDEPMDFAKRIIIHFDLAKAYSIYVVSRILSNIGDTYEELEYMETHIFGDNLKYKGE
ncbi:MAG: hypothetical protein IJU60_05285 [Acholeplasmatales bacterium]|nr:hypothetical protein [Acholeplasmatales bacterium]